MKCSKLIINHLLFVHKISNSNLEMKWSIWSRPPNPNIY